MVDKSEISEKVNSPPKSWSYENRLSEVQKRKDNYAWLIVANGVNTLGLGIGVLLSGNIPAGVGCAVSFYAAKMSYDLYIKSDMEVMSIMSGNDPAVQHYNAHSKE